MEELDPRLTINNLTGSKGGLIIDKAYAHLWASSLNSTSSTANFSGLINSEKIKKNQGFGYYYSFDNLIPGFYIQPIKYIPYDAYTNYWCHMYSRGYLLKITPDASGSGEFGVSSDSAFNLQNGDSCHLGWSYIYFDAFGGATDYSLDSNNASNIKNFHSSLRIPLSKGKKIDLSTLSDRSKVFLIKTGYFYCLKITPWPEESGGKPNRTCELIINVLDSKNMTTSICIGASGSTTDGNENLQIGRHDDTTLRIYPPSQSNVMKIEVFELPFQVNDMIISGRREYATNTSDTPSKRGTELVWTFDELKKSNFHITSYDLTLKGEYSVAATGNGFCIISGDKGMYENPGTLTGLKDNTDFALKTITVTLTAGFPVYNSDTRTTKLVANNSGEVSLNVGSSYYEFSTATLTIHGYYVTTPEYYD